MDFPKPISKELWTQVFLHFWNMTMDYQKQLLSLNQKYVWIFLWKKNTTLFSFKKNEEGKHLQFIELTEQCMPYPIIGIGVGDGEIQADIGAHSRFLNISFHLIYYIHQTYGEKLIAEVNLKSSKK